jgi:outer membrane lipoprotein-sorting protein
MVLTDRAKPKMARAFLRASSVVMLLCSPAFLLAQAVPQADDDELARSIVEKADRVRFPGEAFETSVAISSTDANGPADVRRYRIFAKGQENTIVMVMEPASERGQALLMKGHDLWIFLPAVSQPVRLSLAQRLTGQVANGDLARANFAGDYTAKLLRTEETDNESLYVLELTAVDRSVTYHRVMYWVHQSNNRPSKAEFYSLSDRLLKTCLYQNYKPMAGRERPTRLVMQNALLKDEESVLEYSGMRVRDLPDRMFTKDYLKRLE